MPSLSKLAHVAMVTPDLDRSLRFFRDVLGLEEVDSDGTAVYLRAGGELDHHSLSLREGPAAIDHIAFRVGGPQDLAAFGERFRSLGLDVHEVAAGEERGQGEALRFTVPHAELAFELVWDLEKPLADDASRSRLPQRSTAYWRQGVSPNRLDHVNCCTSPENIAAGEEWLIEEFGFKRREYVESVEGPLLISFLSVTPQVHDIGLTADAHGRTGRFHHLAYALESPADLLRASDIIRENGVQVDVWPGRHGIGNSHFFYIRDPGSGHRVELCCGGYPIYDPDWEPVRWDETTLEYGLVFSGPEIAMGPDSPMADTTPATAQAEVAA